MRIYLSGQKWFGAAVLDRLLGLGHEVVGVCAPAWADAALPPWAGDEHTRPDRLRFLAERRGLPWLPAGQLRARELPEGVDLIVAAHSHDYVGRQTRQKARLGAIGYHPSLLPLHRGRDAVYWTIRLGDRVAGGTVYWLDDNVDSGPVAAQGWCHVRPGDDKAELWRRDLAPLGLRLFERVLDDLGNGVIVAIPQDEELATWEPSVGRPPLFRPELPLIGPPPEGFRVIKSGSAG